MNVNQHILQLLQDKDPASGPTSRAHLASGKLQLTLCSSTAYCLEQSSHTHFCEVLFLGNLTLFAPEGHWTVSQVSWDSGAMETIAYTSTRIPGSCAHHSKHF